MLNLQLDQFVYGMLGLPEDVSLFDADDAALEVAAQQLRSMRFTGAELLDALNDWITEVKDTNYVAEQEQQFSEIMNRMSTLIDTVTPEEQPEESDDVDAEADTELSVNNVVDDSDFDDGDAEETSDSADDAESDEDNADISSDEPTEEVPEDEESPEQDGDIDALEKIKKAAQIEDETGEEE